MSIGFLKTAEFDENDCTHSGMILNRKVGFNNLVLGSSVVRRSGFVYWRLQMFAFLSSNLL